MDAAAAASFEATFGKGIVYTGPIQDWLASDRVPDSVDIVVGGPPCQGFSLLGKRDENDERNKLWQQYAETLVRVKPKYFVVENVAAFFKSPQFELFKAQFEQGEKLADYAFDPMVLNAADFGAAQARKRAVLIGYRKELGSPGAPIRTHSPDGSDGTKRYATVGAKLRDVPKTPDRDDLFLEKTHKRNGATFPGAFSPRDLHWSRRYEEQSLQRFQAIPRRGNRFDLPDDLKAECWKDHTSGSGDVMGRLWSSRPSVTIRTEFFKPEKGRYLHPTEHRAITHYEAALLQGFRGSHRFVGSKSAIARQIGNAVPIPLGRAIAAQLLPHL
ncbi:putative BsuMI modification methylase subunit YdiO [Leucobacter soli]|uniref:DNA (cytosine-5-)-methyltransferase n=2 Tax=Leucobacter soli TaxID=2812850 RepID=A0A916JY30_9MICO|nr:putative BsuMI modification methylase subunit YdiO [Leucobacter soli]